MKARHNQKGFTLIEILLVVAAIAILAGIVVVSVNPAKQLRDTRDAERRSEIATIAQAFAKASVAGYDVTTDGEILTGTCDITAAGQKLCTDNSCTATGQANLPDLVLAELPSVPTDPSGVTNDESGYYVVKNATGAVTVCAQNEGTTGNTTDFYSTTR
jgi:prepilin-type N-terminal cleavage/methylation domain-containing protein